MTDGPDCWSRWLLDRRFGGDDTYRKKALTEILYPVRDTLLDNAQLRPDDTLLDVGTGDGLIAFGALKRLGSSGRVIFSDISQALLDHCRRDAEARGLLERCRFVLAPADCLVGVADMSADVVTTRSVLIYVKDKSAALREFYRVLKPGGRVSSFEPINALMGLVEADRLFGYDVSPVRDLATKVQSLYESIQPPGVDPMTDFDDRDLVRHAGAAGFSEIHLDLRVSVKAQLQPVPWELFTHFSNSPLVPTFGEAMERVLSPQEAAELTGYLRPLVESGAGLERLAHAYLSAVKGEAGGARRSEGSAS
jgi:arsenite methyltransferase